MTLVEKHIVKEGTKEYRILDELCYLSKNLYNATLYRIRQEYIKSGIYLSYYGIQKEFQDTKQFDYIQLPAKVSQATMRMVDQNFKSFFASIKDWKINPEKYKGKPKLPKYLDSTYGRYATIYTSQAISVKELKNGYIVLSKVNGIRIRTKKATPDNLCQVRIIPKGGHIAIEIVYEIPDVSPKPDNGNYSAIDLGVNNLITLTDNIGGTPIVISGRRIKSINHHYNKLKSKYQSLFKPSMRKSTRRTRRLERKRENKINDYFHKSSRLIVNYLVSRNINTLIVGNNKGWKQNTNLGKVCNQNFIQIPFYRLIDMLKYKCSLEGITVEVISEEYTSKCSFLDQESIEKHTTYCGKRKHRGLFISSTGVSINADVNGSYNILRKCKPGAFAKGIQGVVVHPHIFQNVESNF